MTSEYDELLAHLEAGQEGNPEDIGVMAAAAIRALTAQVVERDAVIELIDQYRKMIRDDPDLLWRGRTIAKDIASAIYQAPRDALAARDAVRDKTVRATVLRDAAVESKLWSSKGLRARADQEEL